MFKICINLVLCCLIFLIFNSLQAQTNDIVNTTKKQTVSLFDEPSSTIKIKALEAEIENSYQRKDTTYAMHQLIILSDLYANNAQYGKSYDSYWKVLAFAECKKDSVAIALTYNGLGWLYSLYQRSKEAKKYFNLSLAIDKKLQKGKKIDRYEHMVDNYYALATLYRKEKDVKSARTYLDSIKIFRKKLSYENDGINYDISEEGYHHYLEGNYSLALKKLNISKNFFEKLNHSYLGIVYSFLGDVYQKTRDYKKSKYYYSRSLKVIDSTNMHLDLKPEIYESLASVYALNGEVKMAYQSLQQAKVAAEQQFGSRSTNNKELLEIKDDYRIAKDKRNLEQLEYEKEVSNLKAIILAGGLIFLIITGTILFTYFRSRYKHEKALMQKKQELEINKSKEILEIKNKELTTSTLRIIEKEELLSDLKEKLKDQKKNPNADELNKLVKSIDINTANNWNEFEASFSSVNESFYHCLSEQFPELSHSDKKICALIKLNFSSKDMSRLLGISTESVHTTRYRLRKKLHLAREVNLYEFIQNIG